jgi:hypothetical protein
VHSGATHDTELLGDPARRVALLVPVDPGASDVDGVGAVDPGAGAPADAVARLEDQDLAAGAGELAGGDGAGPACADDDGVERGHAD